MRDSRSALPNLPSPHRWVWSGQSSLERPGWPQPESRHRFIRSLCKNSLGTLFLLVLLCGASRGQAQDQLQEEWKACKLDTVAARGKLRLLTGPENGYYIKVGKSI